ncbi:MAG: ATP-dependent sacrificial sulfur transferase LarE [Planctomycetota bacterium]|jgi:uncharacterized protein|nr:ATP-dependent sacrificial sulfur transferase LarE [Planctomycetota bacterium]
MNARLVEKYRALRRRLAEFTRIAVAFSGGVDSSLLLWVAKDETPGGVVAFVADSVFLPDAERAAAQTFARELRADARFVPFDPLSLPDLRSNRPERCYICKKELMTRLLGEAKKERCDVLLDGTNVDDLSDDRPGLRAIRELGILSPLAEAGLTKRDVRGLSRDLGLSGYDRPALSCLATRFPTGVELTEKALRRIDAGETLLRSPGFASLRVRDLDGVAVIELGEAELEAANILFARREAIRAAFLDLGFSRVAVDLGGYRRGSMNTAARD